MDLRIAICDDEKYLREYMTALVSRWARESGIKIKTDIYNSAEQFKMMRESGSPHDILLLDIQMGGQDGVALARELRKDGENKDLIIVFITGTPDFIHDGYDVSALHYLLKPVDEEKLFDVLTRAYAQIKKVEHNLLLPVDGEVVRVNVNDILYVESFAHYLEIAVATNILTVKMPAYKLEEQLGEGFVRCHRSYMVNMRHVAKLTKTDVILDNEKVLPISRRMYNEVSGAFLRYIQGLS